MNKRVTDLIRGDVAVRARQAVIAALPAWLTARVIVISTLLLAHFLVHNLHPASTEVAVRVHEGLLGWDAGWYQSIATHGYAVLPRSALRFFPLVPLLARASAAITGLTAGTGLLIVTNAFALAATALLYELARRETGDEKLAIRSTWLLSLAPPAFVLVMGYSEAVFITLAIGIMLAVRSRHWAWVLPLGYLAGLCRPLGILLAAPIAIEVARRWRAESPRRRLLAVPAIVSPLAGTATYMAWVWASYGKPLLPFAIQIRPKHRGSFANPLATLAHDASFLFQNRHIGTGLHVPWVILAVGLTAIAIRRWPAPYGVLAAVIVATAISQTNLDSFERYALTAFPLILAAGSLTASRRVERAVLALSVAGMVAYGLLAFLGAYVP